MVTTTQEISRETVNIEAAGKMLGVSRAVAYDLARRDMLPVPVIRLGRRMVVSKRAIEALLDTRKDDAA
jgi:predicted DNA-binding transcriptional regulator AlpA